MAIDIEKMKETIAAMRSTGSGVSMGGSGVSMGVNLAPTGAPVRRRRRKQGRRVTAPLGPKSVTYESKVSLPKSPVKKGIVVSQADFPFKPKT